MTWMSDYAANKRGLLGIDGAYSNGMINIQGGGSSSGDAIKQLALGSVFNILGSAVEIAAYSAAGGIGGGNATVSAEQNEALQGLNAKIANYVSADSALDTAKENMQTAINELNDLNQQLKDAQDAKTSGIKRSKDALSEYTTNENSNQNDISDYQKAVDQYQRDMSAYNEFLGLQNQVKDFDKTGLVINGSNAKADGSGETEVSSNAGPIKLPHNGNAAAEVTQEKFKISSEYPSETENNASINTGNNDKIDQAKYQNALRIAQDLDSQYQERVRKANEYNNLVNKMDACTQKEPPKNPKNEPINKQITVNGKSVKISEYLDNKGKLEAEVTSRVNIGTDTSIKAIQDKITAKKTQIKGDLTTKLTSAQQKFDKAKAEIDAIKLKAQTAQNQENLLAEYKAKAKGTNTGGFLGLFKKKSPATQNYKEAKQNVKNNNAQFAAQYGTNYTDVLSKMVAAQNQVNEVDIKLDPSQYKNL